MSTPFSAIDDYFEQVLATLKKVSNDLDLVKSKLNFDLDQNQLYTPKEVARLIKVSDRTVYNLIWTGRLATIRVGRKLYITAQEFEKIKLNGTRGNK